MSAPWKYDRRIASDPNNCSLIISDLLDELVANGWSNKDTFGIHMAMEEAIMNAIHHGNRCQENKEVHVLIELGDNNFFAKVTDEGCGFDPEDVPDPTTDENVEKESGRGVMLIKHFVDEVRYNDTGNSVQLKKKRSE